MGGDLAARITAFVEGHDSKIRAAVYLTTHSVLIRKIGGYVDGDGWVEWDRLGVDLLDGLPWSGGEVRLALLAVSLSGQMANVADDDRTADVLPWTLDQLLYGIDMPPVLDAIHLAATGHLPPLAEAEFLTEGPGQ